MKALARTLAAIATLLLAAHVLRTGQLPLVLAILGLLPLLAVRRSWAGTIVTIALWVGAAEWVRTLVFRVQERSASGQPFGRLVVILGSVALFTAMAALATQYGPLGRWYRSSAGDASPDTSAPGQLLADEGEVVLQPDRVGDAQNH